MSDASGTEPNGDNPSDTTSTPVPALWRTTATTGVAALLGLLAGASQLIGWIDVTVRTALITMVLAIIFVWGAPALIVYGHREKYGVEPPQRTVRVFAVMSAAVLVVAVTLPVGVRLLQARSAEHAGRSSFRAQHYAAALPDLQSAVEGYSGVGLDSWAVPSEIRLYQTLAELGRLDEADAVGDELRTRSLSSADLGRVYGADAIIAQTFGEFERAQTLFQQARQLVEPGSTDEATLLVNEAVLILTRGSIREQRALDNLDLARDIHERAGDQLGVAYVMTTEAQTKPTPGEQRAVLEQALVIAIDEADDGLRAEIEAEIGRTLAVDGEIDEALKHYDAALSAFEDLANPLGQAVIYSNLAVLESERGNQAVARAHLAEARARFSHLSLDGNEAPPRRLAHLYDLSGVVTELLGERDLARADYEQALSILDDHPDPLLRADVLVNLAGLDATAGHFDTAERRFDEAEALLQRLVEPDESSYYATLLVNRAALAVERGDVERAADYIERAVEAASASGDQYVLGEACNRSHLMAQATMGVLGSADGCTGSGDDQVSEARELLAAYALTPDSEDIAAELLELTEDPTLSPPDELQILVWLTIKDLMALDQLTPVDARLREVLNSSQITDGERVLVVGQLARIADIQQRDDEAADFARQALAMTTALSRPEQPAWRLWFGFILATNGSPEAGLDAMWEGFLDGQQTVFVSDPMSEHFYVLNLEWVFIDHGHEIDLAAQRPMIEAAIEGANSPGTVATLESMLADLLVESP